MNDLQKRELHLLECFISICKKLNLTYYLVCGSALGAAKYQGFIPWDDDIDVALCRNEYEIFLKEAPRYLERGLFLQNYRTDVEFPHVFSKLRDSKTTFIEKNKQKLKINHGVYIDIFPLDGYPSNIREQKILEFKKRMYLRQLACTFSIERNFKSMLSYTFHRLLGCHKRSAKIVRKYENMISKYAIENSEIWCNHGNWQGKLEYAPCRQYGKGTIVEFEGIAVRIPEKIDEYLSQKYGEWKKDPPQSEKKGKHSYVVCDLSNPYTKYIDK